MDYSHLKKCPKHPKNFSLQKYDLTALTTTYMDLKTIYILTTGRQIPLTLLSTSFFFGDKLTEKRDFSMFHVKFSVNSVETIARKSPQQTRTLLIWKLEQKKR